MNIEERLRRVEERLGLVDHEEQELPDGGLTDAQRNFIESTERRGFSAFIGARQVGHSTAISIGASRSLKRGEDSLVLAPTYDIASGLADKTKKFCPAVSDKRKLQIYYKNNSITFRSVHGGLGKIDLDEYDRIFIDNVDNIGSNIFGSVLVSATHEVLHVHVAGTPDPSHSENIFRILTEDRWHIVHADMESTHFVDDERIDDISRSMNSTQAAVEVWGKVVRDPAADADFVAGED